jgi:acetyl-CoA/propionyl-CoA carboxylase biotin carboxyl carrier protein
MPQLRKVLIANRGEIAVRVIRAARDAGVVSVAVFTDADHDAPHVVMADEAVALDGTTVASTYLSVAALLAAARRSGADSLHPGYGFLSEDADFAQAVIDADLVWIGPSPDAIRLLGDKMSARRIAAQVGLPLLPGTTVPLTAAADIHDFADDYGLPLVIKAAFGGGGRGMKVVRTRQEIPVLFEAATREALAAFGRSECFVERYLECPRHVEAQILADQHGNLVVVGTRDCSLQRRHQKLVEEAPAPYLSDAQRTLIHESAKAICRAANYTSAGTVEFLVGHDGTVAFLEVNTRLQVEHPVTEETTGVDLVREMFRIAAGERLSATTDVAARGHSFEFRLNAEDPGRAFLPALGTIGALTWPQGPGVRVDSGVTVGSTVDGRYDSLLAKVIVTGADRTQALERSQRAMGELAIGGVATIAPFHRAILTEPAFTGLSGTFSVHTRWIERDYVHESRPPSADGDPGSAESAEVVHVVIGGRRMTSRVPGLRSLGPAGSAIRSHIYGDGAGVDDSLREIVTSPMQGTIVRINVTEGQAVDKGDLIFVVEAMKMENGVMAHRPGTVVGLTATVGVSTAQDAVFCRLV